jgi:hypothetical protein
LRIARTLKATGASHVPFHSFAANPASFELVLCAHGQPSLDARLSSTGSTEAANRTAAVPDPCRSGQLIGHPSVVSTTV